MNSFILFLILTLSLAIGTGLGFWFGRASAPPRIERIVETIAAPIISNIADHVSKNNQLMLDVERLGRANKVCTDKLGVLRQRTKAAEAAAQKSKEEFDVRSPVTAYDTTAANAWGAALIPPEVTQSLGADIRAAAEPECLPQRADNHDRTNPCSAPAERVHRCDSHADSVPADSRCNDSSSSYDSGSSSSYSSSSSDSGSSSSSD